jgi:hypothetical protein
MRGGTARHDDLAVTSGSGEGGHDLEDPDTARRAAESEIPGDSQRGLGAGCLINARGESQPAYVCGKDGTVWCCRGGVIRCG